METPAIELIPHLEAFRGFVRGRVGDGSVADDIVQESLLRAVRAAPELRDEDALLPWFYRILRNAVTDHYRRRDLAGRAMERAAAGVEASFTPEDERVACGCLANLVDELKPEYAELIREMDLGGASLATMSERIGASKANLKMRHHRARKRLRTLLERTCRTCAAHGCLDCTCKTNASPDG